MVLTLDHGPSHSRPNWSKSSTWKINYTNGTTRGFKRYTLNRNGLEDKRLQTSSVNWIGQKSVSDLDFYAQILDNEGWIRSQVQHESCSLGCQEQVGITGLPWNSLLSAIRAYEHGWSGCLQFQRVVFTRDFWTIKSELEDVINMKIVHCYAENKSIPKVYLGSQYFVQKSYVNKASRIRVLNGHNSFKTPPNRFKPLATVYKWRKKSNGGGCVAGKSLELREGIWVTMAETRNRLAI
jgi:hypothetical protein